eukprot:gene11209-13049_t
MDEYQYDELSMAIGFAHFAAEMAAQAVSPMRSPILRPPTSPRQRSLRWQPSGHFHLSRTNSYQEHDIFPSIVPEYVEETVLERLQVEIGVIEEEEGSPPIIDGPIYTDDEILKLDLFHRSRSNTISGSSKNGQFEGYFASSPLRPITDANLPSGRSSRSSNGNKSAESAKQVKTSIAETAGEVEGEVVQKTQIKNLLMGIAGRQRPGESNQQDYTKGSDPNQKVADNKQSGPAPVISNSNIAANNTTGRVTSPSAEADAAPTDQKAQIRNALLAGLTARKKPVEATEAKTDVPTSSDAPVDQKSQVRNALMAGLAARQKPAELAATSPPSSNIAIAASAPNKDPPINSEAPADQKAQVRNLLMAGLASRQKPPDATEVSGSPPSKVIASPANVTPTKEITNKDAPTSSEAPADQKAQVRNALMAGLAARQKPAELTSPTTNTSSSASKTTPLPNSSRTSDITETDSWSPALRALPPLPISPTSPPIPPTPGSLK